MSEPTPPPPSETRDWLEDAGHENGDYQNRCMHCREIFIGHKRRVVCKLCAQIQPPPSETKLKGLEAFQKAVDDYGNAMYWKGNGQGTNIKLSDFRSSLESLYRELIDDLRLSEKAAETWRIACDQNGEALSALRSLQLTPAEARLVLHALETNGYAVSITSPIIEKLQRISSKATSEDPK